MDKSRARRELLAVRGIRVLAAASAAAAGSLNDVILHAKISMIHCIEHAWQSGLIGS